MSELSTARRVVMQQKMVTLIWVLMPALLRQELIHPETILLTELGYASLVQRYMDHSTAELLLVWITKLLRSWRRVELIIFALLGPSDQGFPKRLNLHLTSLSWCRVTTAVTRMYSFKWAIGRNWLLRRVPVDLVPLILTNLGDRIP